MQPKFQRGPHSICEAHILFVKTVAHVQDATAYTVASFLGLRVQGVSTSKGPQELRIAEHATQQHAHKRMPWLQATYPPKRFEREGFVSPACRSKQIEATGKKRSAAQRQLLQELLLRRVPHQERQLAARPKQP